MANNKYNCNKVYDKRRPETCFVIYKNGQCQQYQAQPEAVFNKNIHPLHKQKLEGKDRYRSSEFTVISSQQAALQDIFTQNQPLICIPGERIPYFCHPEKV